MRDGSREQDIIEQYEAWDPDDESIAELVDQIGISRQRLYQVLDKHNVKPKSKRPNSPKLALVDEGGKMSELAHILIEYGQLIERYGHLAEPPKPDGEPSET